MRIANPPSGSPGKGRGLLKHKDLQECVQCPESTDDKIRMNALQTVLAAAEKPVDRAYEGTTIFIIQERKQCI